MVKISDLQIKEVINISDGSRLGHISDIDINLDTGRIEAIIVSGAGRVLGLFGREEQVVISWKNILKIGEDVVLVRYNNISNFHLLDGKNES